MTKFMLLQNYEASAACDVPMTEWALEDIKVWPGRSWPSS
jgi:hypothetical protein